MDLDLLVDLALNEDIPNGDLTTDPLGCDVIKGIAKLVAKQDLILSGCAPFEKTFKKVDLQNHMHWKFRDGDRVQKGIEVCSVAGPLASLLKAERTALNFLGHLSGIATLTNLYVEQAHGTKTKIIDTRKTLPGLRALEKAAVVHGGGENHRMSLSDGVLIKENHIRAAGGISNAVSKLRKKWGTKPIEVEVTTAKELAEALVCGVERILLDNMSLEQMAEAVKEVRGRALIEASGNMTLDRIKSVAKLGVNFISVGSLTHSAPNADLSLQFERNL